MPLQALLRNWKESRRVPPAAPPGCPESACSARGATHRASVGRFAPLCARVRARALLHRADQGGFREAGQPQGRQGSASPLGRQGRQQGAAGLGIDQQGLQGRSASRNGEDGGRRGILLPWTRLGASGHPHQLHGPSSSARARALAGARLLAQP